MRARSPTPRPARRRADDIERIIGDYAAAARNAIRAGFDGVQVHGANGYLVDQFLRDGSNFRDDEYGGSIDNRLRFATEVLEAVGDEIGMDKVGIRFSPNIYSQGVEDSDPIPLFTALADRLEELKVPWIELREPQPADLGRRGADRAGQPGDARRIIRARSCSTAIMTGRMRAQRVSAEGIADGDQLRPAVHRQPRPGRADRGRRAAQRGRRDDLLFGRCARLRRLSDARRSAGRLRRVFFSEVEQGERGLGRAAALVGLGRIGAGDRLRFVLDGQDAVADRIALQASGPSARARSRSTPLRNDRSRRG